MRTFVILGYLPPPSCAFLANSNYGDKYASLARESKHYSVGSFGLLRETGAYFQIIAAGGRTAQLACEIVQGRCGTIGARNFAAVALTVIAKM